MIGIAAEQLCSVHQLLLEQTKGTAGVRDRGLLEASTESVFQVFGGQELYPGILQKAAQLACSLAKNHPFIDGNKRAAAAGMLLFLDLNGIKLNYTQKELSTLFWKLAGGEISRVQLLDWLTAHKV